MGATTAITNLNNIAGCLAELVGHGQRCAVVEQFLHRRATTASHCKMHRSASEVVGGVNLRVRTNQ